MSELSEQLEHGFTLADYTVLPTRNVIEGPDGEQRIEPKSMQVLLYLAAHRNAVVSRQELLDQLWPNTYSGDEALTRCISLLRSSLDENRQDRRFIETVPKTGYRLVAPVVPLAGSTPDTAVIQATKTAATWTRWAFLLIATIVPVALYLVLQTDPAPLPQDVETTAPERSIVVLPFADMSAGQDMEYMADGLTEELQNLLAKIPELAVTSRTSSFSFKGKDSDIREIAAQLGVAHVLEGSVRQSGNKIRVTTQLIEAKTDTHLWSHTYDRELGDIFAIQDDIATQVVKHLRLTLLDQFPLITKINPEAYTLLLQARFLAQQSSEESIAGALVLFRRALVIEPNHAPIWEGIAWYSMDQAMNGWAPLEQTSAYAIEAANRAISIERKSALAHAALSLAQVMTISALATVENKARFESGIKRFLYAYKMDPNNAEVVRFASQSANFLGRWNEALLVVKYAIERDPINALHFVHQARVHNFLNNWSEAAESARTAIKLSPKIPNAHEELGTALLHMGNFERALTAFERESLPIDRLMGLCIAYYSLNRIPEFEQALLQLKRDFGESSPGSVAQVYAWTDDQNASFEWLDRAVETEGLQLRWVAWEASMQSLHGDERWQLFLKKIGMNRDYLATIKFDPLPYLPGK